MASDLRCLGQSGDAQELTVRGNPSCHASALDEPSSGLCARRAYAEMVTRSRGFLLVVYWSPTCPEKLEAHLNMFISWIIDKRPNDGVATHLQYLFCKRTSVLCNSIQRICGSCTPPIERMRSEVRNTEYPATAKCTLGNGSFTMVCREINCPLSSSA